MTEDAPIRLGDHTITRQEILDFAREFDPQPFHVDEGAAGKTHFGGLCASGWHTAALWMRYMVRYRGGRKQSPQAGVSPGFRDLKWLKPVYPDDTLTFYTRKTGERESRHPGTRLVTMENWADNQNGERVFSFQGAVFITDDGQTGDQSPSNATSV